MPNDLTYVHQLLERYQKRHPNEQATLNRFANFLTTHPDAAYRSCLSGHLTASCWLINDVGDAFLLLHHKKLDQWVQPGGHADGCTDLLAVAQKEVMEETGLMHIKALDTTPMHMTIYTIPAYQTTPTHWHFDACFAFKVTQQTPLQPNDESHAMAWFDVEQPPTMQPSMQALWHKWQTLKQTVLPTP